MYEQNTSMMNIPEQNAFLLPAMVDGDFSSEEIAEDADGLQMMSFQRVKIPAGGQLQFEIPTEDPDNPDYTIIPDARRSHRKSVHPTRGKGAHTAHAHPAFSMRSEDHCSRSAPREAVALSVPAPATGPQRKTLP